MEEFNQRLSEVVEKKRRKDKLLSLKKEIENHFRHQREKLGHLEVQLAVEGRDIEKLEGLSLTGLFHSVLGNKEQQLEKERQEYLAVKLKYDQCVAELSDLEQKQKQVIEALSQMADIENTYNAFMMEKERRLLGQQSSVSLSLTTLSEKIAEAEADLREVKEAIQAGYAVLSETDMMLRQLSSAQSWGIWDMVGGGIITTAIKHSKINDSKASAQRIQQLLGSFQRELADVDGQLIDQGNLGMDSFLTFADYFFDGLIADWVVQSKINNSKEQTEELQYQVKQVVRELERTEKNLSDHLEKMAAERKGYLEKE